MVAIGTPQREWRGTMGEGDFGVTNGNEVAQIDKAAFADTTKTCTQFFCQISDGFTDSIDSAINGMNIDEVILGFKIENFIVTQSHRVATVLEGKDTLLAFEAMGKMGQGVV